MEELSGEIGIKLKYYYSLLPREFKNIVTGSRKRENEQFKNSWELARQIMWASLIPHQKQGSNLTPERVLSFPWEKNVEEIVNFNVSSIEDVKTGIAEWEIIDSKRKKIKDKTG